MVGTGVCMAGTQGSMMATQGGLGGRRVPWWGGVTGWHGGHRVRHGGLRGAAWGPRWAAWWAQGAERWARCRWGSPGGLRQGKRGHGLWLCIGSTCDLYCRGAYVLGHTPARWLTHSVLLLLLLQMSSGGSAVVVDQISQPLSFNTPGGCGSSCSIGTSCSTSCSCTSVLLPGCWYEWGLSAEYLQCCGSKGLCPRCLH